MRMNHNLGYRHQVSLWQRPYKKDARCIEFQSSTDILYTITSYLSRWLVRHLHFKTVFRFPSFGQKGKFRSSVASHPCIMSTWLSRLTLDLPLPHDPLWRQPVGRLVWGIVWFLLNSFALEPLIFPIKRATSHLVSVFWRC